MKYHVPEVGSRWILTAVLPLTMASLLICSVPTAAQEQMPATSSSMEGLQEVIVTGSRIASVNATSTSPIQVVTAKEVQQGGKTDIIDLINQLPQNFQNSSVDFSNTSNGLAGPGGISTADLRGLGPQRTLVLINGRRLGIGDPNTANPNPAPDLDQIPVALIDRIEVVTGGASATYGSDAIAGVVNFIMKKDFEGIEIDGQVGEYTHHDHEQWMQNLEAAAGTAVESGSVHDGQNRSFSLLMGTNLADGKGNVTAYVNYLNADPIPSSARDFGGCQLDLTHGDNGAACHGSQNSNWFQPPSGTVYSVVGNQLLPWPQAGSNPPALYNAQSLIYMARGDERYTAGVFGHVDINDNVKPYLELGFMDDKTTIDVAPSGLFQSNITDPTNNGNFNINCSNPLLSAQEQSILCSPAQIAAAQATPGAPCATPPSPVPTGYVSPNCANVNIGRRNIEGGPRVAYWDHTNYRAVVGATGEIADGWSYDAYGQYYTTTLFNSNSNYVNLASVDNALQVSGTAANPTCISGPSCVPWNIFKTGGVTASQVSYLNTTGTSTGTATERILHADVTGQLGKYGLKSPLANDGVGVNIGAEHRNDHLSFAPDAAELSGLLSGYGGASVAIDNGISVNEGFVEVRAPLAQDRPGIKDLVVDSGFRHSDYNLAGGVNTYKFEVQYAPVEDIRFRSGYQRAIRAPNILELYTPPGFGLLADGPGIDPCAPTRDPVTGALVPATASLAQCERTGVTTAQYGNGATTNTVKQCVANQCGQLTGGNTGLKPEQADSVTVGFNFDPAFLPGFTSSVDYFHIKIKDEIGVIPAPIILQDCLTTGNPIDCSLIERTSGGSLTGSSLATLGGISQIGLNISAVGVSGVDVQANYRLALNNWGSLGFLLSGSYLLTDTTTPQPGAHTYDCAGLYGTTCGTVNPRWRHNLRVTWSTPWNMELSALWRFIGAVSLDANTSDPTLSAGIYDAFDARMPNMSYLDLSGSWKVVKNFELRAGINNLFDKDPPIVSSNVAGTGATNSFPTYDQLGRQLYAAFTAKF
jgi:iron complex outermembrane receptor protein